MDQVQPIIIKRKSGGGGDGHHGGAWKVAYADFVTAMMAFFLLMWLLNATSEDQRKGLADFFDPSIPISSVSAGGAGMMGGDTMFKPPEAAGSRDEGIRAQPTASEAETETSDKKMMSETKEVPDDATTAAMRDGDGDGDAGEYSAADANGENTADGASAGGIEQVAEDLLDQVREAGGDGLLEHFSMRMTPEGLVIEIVDLQDDPLFASGATEPEPVLAVLADILVPVLAQTTNEVAVVGHTDSSPFVTENGYSNWELSADRANAARRVLTAAGLPQDRIVRISGKAAIDPIDPDPTSAKNRRIAITLLR